MATITISKKLIPRDDLVIISRREYEKLSRIVKKKEHTQLDKELDEAIKEYRAGKTVGPFRSVTALKRSLKK